MQQVKFEIPVLYADHHVLEIKNILKEVEGIKDFFISSAFKIVKIDFDESAISEEELKTLLVKAGYHGDLGFENEEFSTEPGSKGHKKHYRKGVLYTQTGLTQGFKQNVTKTTRKEWPIPGMGVLDVGEEG